MRIFFIAVVLVLATLGVAISYEPPASIFGQNNNFSVSVQLLTTPYTLGNKFTANVSGTITRLSFFKSTLDTTTSRNLILWSSTGTNLAECATTNEPPGFNQWLGCDIHAYDISAGTTLVVSYDAPANSYGAYVISNPTCSTGPSKQQNWLTCVDSVYATSLSTFPNTIDGATDLADVVLTH